MASGEVEKLNHQLKEAKAALATQAQQHRAQQQREEAQQQRELDNQKQRELDIQRREARTAGNSAAVAKKAVAVNGEVARLNIQLREAHAAIEAQAVAHAAIEAQADKHTAELRSIEVAGGATNVAEEAAASNAQLRHKQRVQTEIGRRKLGAANSDRGTVVGAQLQIRESEVQVATPNQLHADASGMQPAEVKWHLFV